MASLTNRTKEERSADGFKVVHISVGDGGGGAARAAYRLHRALREIGVSSEMVVSRKSTNDEHVHGPTTAFEKARELARPRLDQMPVKAYKRTRKALFSPGFFGSRRIVRRVSKVRPDIVHLHWVAGGVLNLSSLRKLGVPIVWTMHDMWPMTGGCHYDWGCGRFSAGCGRCPLLGSGHSLDLSSIGFRYRRRQVRSLATLRLVAPSRWLASAASVSGVVDGRHVDVLPYPIDCEVFAPVAVSEARALLGLPQDKRLVLFGAVQPTQNPIKGFAELVAALKTTNSDDMELVVLGNAVHSDLKSIGLPVHLLGYLADDISLRLAYSSADVTVVPSLQDNLPLVVAESLACGTPVTGFRIGGMPDLVDHMETGYLADAIDPSDLACGIDWVLQHPVPERLRQAARTSAVAKYEQTSVADQHRKFYESILS